MAKHILVVEDDGDVRDILVAILEEHGFAATHVTVESRCARSWRRG
jgi:DNA-binding response OmpR family regulator